MIAVRTMSKLPVRALPFLLLLALPVRAEPLPAAFPGLAPEAAPMSHPLLTAQSLSCTPRKTCKRVESCEAAYWYLGNCSWGYRLDGDSDGVPCESLCR